MSQGNEDFIRSVYEVFNRDDLDGLFRFIDPAIEVRLPEGGIAAGTLSGHQAMREFLQNYFEAFETFRITPTRLWTMGDRVLAECRTSGVGRSSGVTVEVHPLHLWTVRAGKATQLEVFMEREREKALEAIGLRE